MMESDIQTSLKKKIDKMKIMINKMMEGRRRLEYREMKNAILVKKPFPKT